MKKFQFTLTIALLFFSLLMFACGERGTAFKLQTADIPFEFIGEAANTGYAEAIDPREESQQVFLADDEAGMKIYDVSNVYNPVFVNSYRDSSTQATRVQSVVGLAGDSIAITTPSLNESRPSILKITNNGQSIRKVTEFPNIYSATYLETIIDSTVQGIVLGEETEVYCHVIVSGPVSLRHAVYYKDPWGGEGAIYPSSVGIRNKGMTYKERNGHHYLYIAASELGISVAEILPDSASGETIQFLGEHDTPGITYDIFVENDVNNDSTYAYVASGYNGMTIVNTTDFDHMYTVSTLDFVGRAVKVAKYDNYLLVACEGDGLVVVDVTDKANPQFVGSYDPGYVNDVKVMTINGERYVLLAERDRGLLVLRAKSNLS